MLSVTHQGDSNSTCLEFHPDMLHPHSTTVMTWNGASPIVTTIPGTTRELHPFRLCPRVSFLTTTPKRQMLIVLKYYNTSPTDRLEVLAAPVLPAHLGSGTEPTLCIRAFVITYVVSRWFVLKHKIVYPVLHQINNARHNRHGKQCTPTLQNDVGRKRKVNDRESQPWYHNIKWLAFPHIGPFRDLTIKRRLHWVLENFVKYAEPIDTCSLGAPRAR
ncbi:hypothetical protein F5B21DRAFT_19041 [Xylaria acuta]|nr:hypothetical protein F5B21DRAFT_19041 [Xylaria acuta]